MQIVRYTAYVETYEETTHISFVAFGSEHHPDICDSQGIGQTHL